MPPERHIGAPGTAWHRIRHYEGRWSTFDMVEPCKAPAFCIGCQFTHPFCDENGCVAPEEAAWCYPDARRKVTA